MQQERVARGGLESVTEAANSLAFLLLLICVAVVPFPYGAVLPGGTLTIELLAFIVAALAFATSPAATRLGAAAVPFCAVVAIALLGGIQLLPMPLSILRPLSPGSIRIDDETNSLLQLSGGRAIPYRISIAPTETTGTTLLTLAYAALFVSAAGLATSRPRRRAIMATLFATSVGHLLVTTLITGGTERIHGAFVNPNHFAGYLQIPLAFALGMVWLEVLSGPHRVAGVRDRAERLEKRLLPFAWRVLLWGVIAAGIALTRSRGGVLAAAFATLMMIIAGLLHRHRRRGAVAIAVAVILGILFVAFTTGQASILRFLASDPREIPSDTRIRLWRASAQAWHMFPTFGSGLGTFREAFRRVQPAEVSGLVEQAHNDFLQLLVTGGWVGAALGVIAFGALFVALFVGWLRQRHREEAAMVLAAMGALLSLTVHGIVEFNMSIPAIPATLAAMLGASWAAASFERESWTTSS